MAPTDGPRIVCAVLLRSALNASPAEIQDMLNVVGQELTNSGATGGPLVRLRCYNAYDYAILGRTTDFRALSVVPDLAFVKKSHVVFALEDPQHPLKVFEADPTASPLVLLTFAKVHERLALLGSEATIELVRPLAASEEALSVARGLGWADLVFCATGTDINVLDGLLPEGCCHWQVTDLPGLQDRLVSFPPDHPLSGLTPISGSLSVFSRSFTLLARRYELMVGGALDSKGISGIVPNALVRVFVRAGGSRRVIQACPDGWELLGHKGYEDVIGLMQAAPTQACELRDLLRVYEQEFLPAASGGLLSAHLHPLQEVCSRETEPLEDLDLASIRQPVPRLFSDAVADMHDGEDVLLVLRRMYWMCNRLLVNRAQFPFVMDIALHLQWLSQYLDDLTGLAGGEPRPTNENLMQQAIRTVRKAAPWVFDALAQRCHGDYYELFSDAPTMICQYPAGVQRLLLAWWLVAWTVLRAALGDRPARCFILVGHDDAPRAEHLSRETILVFPPRLVYGASSMVWPLCHELGEAVFAGDLSPPIGDPQVQFKYPANSPMEQSFLNYFLKDACIPLDGLQTWENRPLWQRQALVLLREIYCDTFALFATLLGCAAPAQQYFADTILRAQDDPNAVYPAFRAWLLFTFARDLGRPPDCSIDELLEALANEDVLPFVPEPGHEAPSQLAQGIEESWAWVGQFISQAVDDEHKGAWPDAWDTCFSRIQEGQLFQLEMLQAGKLAMVRAVEGPVRAFLARALSGHPPPSLTHVLLAITKWARSAFGPGEGPNSAVLCADLLDLSDRAMRCIGEEVWPLLSG